MLWQKNGLVFDVSKDAPQGSTRAMVPTPVQINEETIRVFFTLCDSDNVGRPHFADVSANDPTRILQRSIGPVMEVGAAHSFDEHGVVPASFVRRADGSLLMYYSGFERGVTYRYRIFTGLAISDDDGKSFRRLSRTPILDRSDAELMFRCAPFVLRDGDHYRMWYVAGSTWEIVHNKEVPRYVLKYLESEDGVAWGDEGALSMDLDDDEHGFGRPWVARDNETYRLFYSIRRRSLAAYSLGYAESTNGIDWERQDDRIGLSPTPGAFDSHGMSYTAPITVNGKTYCFYNGNDFGADGFAVATLL